MSDPTFLDAWERDRARAEMLPPGRDENVRRAREAHPNPSRNDVAELIAQWTADPCWDLEDTDGYEAWREELLAYRTWREKAWAREEEARARARCAELGCTPALLAYIEALERRIVTLEEACR